MRGIVNNANEINMPADYEPYSLVGILHKRHIKIGEI